MRTPRIDDALPTIPAASWYPTDERQIPVGREPVTGTPYDFRQPRRIGTQHTDVAFTQLERDADGRPQLRLTAPDGVSVALWLDAGFPTSGSIPETRWRAAAAADRTS